MSPCMSVRTVEALHFPNFVYTGIGLRRCVSAVCRLSNRFAAGRQHLRENVEKGRHRDAREHGLSLSHVFGR